MKDEHSQARSLVEALRSVAVGDPGRPAVSFLKDGEREVRRLSYGELDQAARGVAAYIQESAGAGARVLLLFPSGLELVTALLGCLYARAVAVPSFPPTSRRSRVRSLAIAADARPQLALTTQALLGRVRAGLAGTPQLEGMEWLAVEDLEERWSARFMPEPPAPEMTALLQYTSGSTAAPRGVMVTHGNLLHNERMIQQAFRQSAGSVIVGWLPLSHDMGLIGNVLQPLFVGAHTVLMPPSAFLERPVRWLRAIGRYRATTSGGPSFAYDLCVAKISPEERADLDLTSWDLAFTGAEPVRAETLSRFASTFAPCGFRAAAFFPCYGLAEATLFVSGSARREVLEASFDAAALERDRAVEVPVGSEGSRRLVSCGIEGAGQRLAIVDPELRVEHPEGVVGEIWVRGPNVAQGYWQQPELSALTFGAVLADTGEGPFLRTGDLGFRVLGELFVTGRLKDLVILRGRNLYPQDLELTVGRSHAALGSGSGACFSVELDGEERLVVVHELEHGRETAADEAMRRIRRAIAEEHEALVHEIVLLRAGTIVKTTSGKIERHSVRAAYLAGSLKEAARSGAAPSASESLASEAGSEDPVAATLRRLAAGALEIDAGRIPLDRPLTELGLDSLAAVGLSHAIQRELGVVVASDTLLRGLALRDIAAAGRQPTARPPRAESSPPEQPLSYGQRALWFLQRLAPESTAYNIAVAARVHSPLDAGALRRAFGSLVARHDALRTTFLERDGEPRQRVAAAVELALESLDATGWSTSQEAAFLADEAHLPFDLERGPLLRIRLLTREDAPPVLLLVVHHIVADLWSLAILARELGVFYRAEAEAAEADLPAQTATYAEHVERQLALLAGADGERLWEFWRRQLAGAPPVIDLPADRTRPAVRSEQGGARLLRLAPDLTARLLELARTQGATLYSTLLAAFLALLQRYSRQDDLVVGSLAAGRARADMAGVVGLFVNPVVVRADLAGRPTFRELQERVRDTSLAAFAHQEIPFSLLAEHLHPVREGSYPPVFQVLFTLQQAPGGRRWGQAIGAAALGLEGMEIDLGGLRLETLALRERRAQFDLSLLAAVSDGRVAASLEYSRDLWDAPSIARLLGHLEALLAAAVAAPDQPVGALPLLGAGERAQLLGEWGVAPAERVAAGCVHELFEAQAAATPDAVALVCGSERWTYRELARRVGRLACVLRSRGVGPETVVGALVERNARMVITLLAILKAGGAYLPLDPDYPRQRLAFMLEDSGCHLLVAEGALLARFPELRRRWPSCDPEAAPESGGEAAGPAGAGGTAGPGNLAYLIYTSGSTGRPKGVAVEHRSVVALVAWARQLFHAGDLDGVLASTSICFDLSVFELFLPLCCGGKVVLSPDALHLPALAASREVRLLNTVPSAAAELVRTGGLPAGLRVVNLAGEPLPGELARELHAACPGLRLYNLYGPSEDTVYSTWARVGGADPHPAIGRPIAGSAAYVLDGAGGPVPVGVAGELHLGGRGLARGYLGRPELTASRFLPDPFGEPGARLYATGDLVRWRPDGELEFLGRLDRQVKIRGFRIELGEVEAALLRLAAVRQAAVIVWERAGDPRLVAYVVLVAEAAGTLAAVRVALAAELPRHLLPAIYVTLDDLPRTASGKLDRAALPPPGDLPAATGEAPATVIEEVLAAIWAELLGVGSMSREDSFFDLGGHSLLATRVVSRISQTMGIELPVKAVFEAPTLAGLVEAASREGEPPPPIAPVPRDGDLPLSFAQRRLWFIDQLEPGSAAYNGRAAVLLRGRLEVPALAFAFSEIARRHEVLRAGFPAVDGQPRWRMMPPSPLALPVVDLSALPTARRHPLALRIAAAASERPFALGHPPLLRLYLLKLHEHEHLLAIVLHHIVGDDWSIGILTAELSAFYAAATGGSPAALPELPVQYPDFAVWQRQWLQEEVLAQQLAYWRRMLRGAPPALELPSARPRTASRRGRHYPFAPPAEQMAALRRLARERKATVFMVLLAAYKAFLYRLTGQDDLVVGAVIANRNRVETEGLIGFFVNTLALRTDLSGNPPFGVLLERVREVTLGAYCHQDLPFEKVVEALQPERDLSHSPFFRVALVFQNTPKRPPDLPGLAIEPVSLDGEELRFDLSLLVQEEGERLTGVWRYRLDRFEAAEVARLDERFGALLADAVEHPERRLDLLGWETEDERRMAAGRQQLRRSNRDKFLGLAGRTAGAEKRG
jgi:amino acid adenylation domain-containing protein